MIAWLVWVLFISWVEVITVEQAHREGLTDVKAIPGTGDCAAGIRFSAAGGIEGRSCCDVVRDTCELRY